MGSSNCGIGECAGTGTISCSGGTQVDSCVSGTPDADDSLCDGIDNDCDGTTDEEFVSSETTCGVGACSGNTGVLMCVSGESVDSCDPIVGATADDATCDGIDDDCDALVDEDYVPIATTCGLGACAGNIGALTCVGGAAVDSCDPLAGSEADEVTCDGIDEDCDGFIDEGQVCQDDDVVTIIKAEYKVRRKELKVEATSSQQPDAVLTITGFGDMQFNTRKNKYELKVKPVDYPGTVTVNSDLGGANTKTVKLR